MSDPEKETAELSKRIYILGVGNVGLLIAHSLAGIPNRPPITFLTRTRASIKNFRGAGSCVELITNGISEVRTGFEAEWAFQGSQNQFTSSEVYAPIQYHGDGTSDHSRMTQSDKASQDIGIDGQSDNPMKLDWEATEDDFSPGSQQDKLEQDVQSGSPALDHNYRATDSQDDETTISHLIVSLKTKDIRAILQVAHRLTKNSAILFLQNGMGYIEEVNEKVFPDPETRPTYLIGVVSHGAKRLKAYTVEHAGYGTIALTILPRKPSDDMAPAAPTARYLLRTLARTPVLAAVQYSTTDLLQRQLEKLAANCIINPLTAIMDCPNGELLHNFHISRLMRLLLAEISLVIRSLPELQNFPNVDSRFNPGKLELYTVAVASSTSENISSMLHDVRNGRETEIEYLNRYIIRRGEELGIRCIMNYMLVQILKGKQGMMNRRDFDRLPMGSGDSLTLNTTK